VRRVGVVTNISNSLWVLGGCETDLGSDVVDSRSRFESSKFRGTSGGYQPITVCEAEANEVQPCDSLFTTEFKDAFVIFLGFPFLPIYKLF
jgi:hypothetical protein